MSSGRKANLRLRDLPFLPLLLVLHVFFTVSSLFLRVYELLTRPEDDISPPKNTIPPRHVGISFASSLSSPRTASSYKIYLGGEAAALRRSIRSAVTWAGEEGIDRLSFYEHTGAPNSAAFEFELIQQGCFMRWKMRYSKISSLDPSVHLHQPRPHQHPEPAFLEATESQIGTSELSPSSLHPPRRLHREEVHPPDLLLSGEKRARNFTKYGADPLRFTSSPQRMTCCQALLDRFWKRGFLRAR